MLLVLNLPLDECIDNTQREMKFRERKKGRRKKQRSLTHDQNTRKAKKGHKPSKAQTPH
jgi:hypothetical protein